MSHQPSRQYKKTWTTEFKNGWSEGYTTALDELSLKINTLLDEHYKELESEFGDIFYKDK